MKAAQQRVYSPNPLSDNQLKNDLNAMAAEMALVGGWEFDACTLKGTWTDEVGQTGFQTPFQFISIMDFV